ncbi:hypothetical protein [Sphingobacterium sp. IITKGP-BTPF85]|nr:hypothetical protein [Sphingobacterium sp. IITKGP-BTPF85]
MKKENISIVTDNQMLSCTTIRLPGSGVYNIKEHEWRQIPYEL